MNRISLQILAFSLIVQLLYIVFGRVALKVTPPILSWRLLKSVVDVGSMAVESTNVLSCVLPCYTKKSDKMSFDMKVRPRQACNTEFFYCHLVCVFFVYLFIYFCLLVPILIAECWRQWKNDVLNSDLSLCYTGYQSRLLSPICAAI